MESKNNFPNKHKKTKLTLILLLIFLPLLITAVLWLPQKIQALTIFSPFGGRVLFWTPEAPGCVEITVAVGVATLGTVIITIEELVVGPPKEGTLGILRIDGQTIPKLPTFHKNKHTYRVPGTWVLGNSIDICNVCGVAEDIPGIKAICKVPVIKKVVEVGCDIVGSTCPLNNLIYRMGSGGLFGL